MEDQRSLVDVLVAALGTGGGGADGTLHAASHCSRRRLRLDLLPLRGSHRVHVPVAGSPPKHPALTNLLLHCIVFPCGLPESRFPESGLPGCGLPPPLVAIPLHSLPLPIRKPALPLSIPAPVVLHPLGLLRSFLVLPPSGRLLVEFVGNGQRNVAEVSGFVPRPGNCDCVAGTVLLAGVG